MLLSLTQTDTFRALLTASERDAPYIQEVGRGTSGQRSWAAYLAGVIPRCGMKQSIGITKIRPFGGCLGDVGGTLARPTGQSCTPGGFRYARYVTYMKYHLTL